MTDRAHEALRALVRGRVQGVGFRAFVQHNGRALALTGFVRNLSDGRSVEVVAEGARDQLDALVRLLRQGPPGSHIERLDTSYSEATGHYTAFGVR